MSRKRPGELIKCIVPSKIQRILEFPVCLVIPFSPTKILTCTNGHAICEKCKPGLNKCGVCRAELTNIRNLCNEEIIAISEFHCENHEFGCEVVLIVGEMLKHHCQCNFRPFKCLASKCGARLHSLNYEQHLKSLHSPKSLNERAEGFRDFILLGSKESLMDLELESVECGIWPIRLFTWNGLKFIIQIQMRTGQMYFRVFSISPLPGDSYFLKIEFRQNEKIKCSVIIKPAPGALHSESGTDETYIPAIIDKSVWKNIIELHGAIEENILCVYYNVVTQ